MNRIAYIISHGHTARGALQTGLLRKLSKYFEVHVIAKTTALETLREHESDSLFIHGFDYKISRGDEQRGYLRAHVHQSIRKNPALWEKHMRRTRDKSNSWKRRVLNHLYYYFGAIIRVLPFGKLAFESFERNGYYKRNAAELLESLKVDAIISTRPVDEMEIFLLEASRRLDILKIYYILSWDNITSKGIFPIKADVYLTWGPIMNEELLQYFSVDSDKVHNTGVTHFDIHAQVKDERISVPDLLNEIRLDSSKPYLFFTMSASYYAPNEIDIVEHLAKQIESNHFGEEMQLVIRPHMANLMSDRSDQSWLRRLERINTDRVRVDFPDSDNSLLTWYMAKDDMIRLSGLLNGASVCLNSGSTVAIEALYLDRPVVITAFDTEKWPYWNSAKRLREYIHLKKLFDTKSCALVDSLSELDQAINEYLSDPSKDAAERKKAVELECFKNDGLSTERLVEHVRKLVLG